MPEAEAREGLTAADRYERLQTERSPHLDNARTAAELTIPSLLPPDGEDIDTLPSPFQSVGARGVNNLASKMLLALFPPQGSFFRLTIEASAMAQLKQAAEPGQDVVGRVDAALSEMETTIQDSIEQTNARTVLSNAFRHLLVSGNYLLHIQKDGSLKGHPLSNYVVKRDLEGNPLQIVILEELAPMSAPEEIRRLADSAADTDVTDRDDDGADDTIKVYTYVRKSSDGNRWIAEQEVAGKVVEDSRSTFPANAPAFVAVRWNAIDNSSYGRGLVQEYLGDLQSLESINQSIIEFAAAASKILFLLDPGSSITEKRLQDAVSGDFIEGKEQDISTVSLEKFPDFRVAREVAEKIEARLEEAFLLNSSVQRDAERVTATEVRFIAGELEKALGGIYSTLSDELQRPLVNRWINVLQKNNSLPELPDNSLTPKIVTGLDSLGRSSDLQKLDVLVQGVGELFGPEAMSDYMDVSSYIRRKAAALGLETEGLVRSEEEVQRIRQQRQRAKMAEKAAGPGVQAVGRLAEKRAEIESQANENTES